MSKKIALLSDSHSYMGNEIIDAIKDCDELWHAGDVGDYAVIDKLDTHFKTIRLVHGNIDGFDVRTTWPKDQLFICEGVKVFMTHIGGYPGRYNKRVRAILEAEKPNLYICGHSHILKVVRDKRLNLLHMNPGACGHYGFHFVRTLIKFELHQSKIKDVAVVELGKRGRLT
jgi:putative phosphoesterase